MNWEFPAIAAAVAFVFSTAWSACSALRNYDQAMQAGKVPPESSWGTHFGRFYVRSSPPRTRIEARRNSLIYGCRIGIAVALIVFMLVDFVLVVAVR